MEGVEELIIPRCNQRLVWPRHVAMYLCRKLTRERAVSIGKAFRRKHGTVLHACKVVEDRISVYPKEAQQLKEIERKINKK